MYEAIIITNILMHFCSQKGVKTSMLYYFPSPRCESDLCSMQTTMFPSVRCKSDLCIM